MSKDGVEFFKVEETNDQTAIGIKATVLTASAADGQIGAELLSGSAGGKLGLDQNGLEAKIDMNATLASAKLGPVEAKVGIGVETGVKAGPDGVGLKLAGTGFGMGSNGIELSVFGSSISFNPFGK